MTALRDYYGAHAPDGRTVKLRATPLHLLVAAAVPEKNAVSGRHNVRSRDERLPELIYHTPLTLWRPFPLRALELLEQHLDLLGRFGRDAVDTLQLGLVSLPRK